MNTPLLIDITSVIANYVTPALVTLWTGVFYYLLRRKASFQDGEQATNTFAKEKQWQARDAIEDILPQNERAVSFKELASVIAYAVGIFLLKLISMDIVIANGWILTPTIILFISIPIVAIYLSQKTLKSIQQCIDCLGRYVAVENNRKDLLARMRADKSTDKDAKDLEPHLKQYNRYIRLKEASIIK
jgi:uncharacterized membrane protein